MLAVESMLVSLLWNIDRGRERGKRFRYFSLSDKMLCVSVESALMGDGGVDDARALIASRRSCHKARFSPQALV